MPIKESELILNPDGSIYHLNLKPQNISDTIIFVGDPDRVNQVARHFDSIEFETQKREFKTKTGYYKKKRLTVISTGIGAGNIDIVLNELDALININFNTREINKEIKKLNIIRIGTSGAIQSNIDVNSFLLSSYGLDINGMLQFYKTNKISNPDIENAFINQTNWHSNKAKPLIIKSSNILEKKFESDIIYKGITATASGFYGPQGRILRLTTEDDNLNSKMGTFIFKELSITNLEMETSAIYGISKLLGHNAISLNAIIANRATGVFSKNPLGAIDDLIQYTLKKIIE